MVKTDRMRFLLFVIFFMLLLISYKKTVLVNAKTNIRFTETTTAVVKGKKVLFCVNSSKIKWSVSDPSKADINKNGRLKAKKTGWVIVEAKVKKSRKTVKQKVLIVDKNGTVNNQKQLNAVLFSSRVNQITIKTEEEKSFIIEGDYPEKKLLIVDAPESEITILNKDRIQEIREISGSVNYMEGDGQEIIVGPGALDEKYFQAVITEFYSENEMEVEYIRSLYGDDIYQPGTKLRIRFEPEETRFVPKEWWTEETPIIYNIELFVGDKVEIAIKTSDIGEDVLEAYVCIRGEES